MTDLHFKKLPRQLELLGKPAKGNLKVYSWPLRIWVEELDEKDPSLLHAQAPKSILMALKAAIKAAPVLSSFRAAGTSQASAVYGVLPRVEIRASCRACRFTKTTFQDKKGFQAFADANEWVAEQYEKFFPRHYKAAVKDTSTIHKDFRWNDTPYLTINCNFNQQIPCHRDSGNLKTALSTVLIISEGVTGGELDCPELGLSLAQLNGGLTLFRGDEIVHGVRPFKRASDTAFRCSMVFYTMGGMKTCGSLQEEVARANFLECSKAKARFSAKGKLEVLVKGRHFFSPEEYEKLLRKWEAKAAEEDLLLHKESCLEAKKPTPPLQVSGSSKLRKSRAPRA